jgi:hypothetical protein
MEPFDLPEPDPPATPDGQPPAAEENQGNISEAIHGLLGAFGIAPASQRESAEQLAATALADAGFDAKVTSLRYGTLVVEADPTTARLLEYAREQVLAAVQDGVDEAVTQLRVRVVTA